MTVDSSLLDDPSAYLITLSLRQLTEEEATPTQVGTVPNGLFRSNLLTDDEFDAKPVGAAVAGGEEEIVQAKFVVGCDGARSWVRKRVPQHPACTYPN